MEISAKELRKQPGKVLKRVSNGQEVVVTYRGKKLAKFVSLESDKMNPSKIDGKDEIFGLWQNHDNALSVDEVVRKLREPRSF